MYTKGTLFGACLLEVVGDALAFPVAITGGFDLFRATRFVCALGLKTVQLGLLLGAADVRLFQGAACRFWQGIPAGLFFFAELRHLPVMTPIIEDCSPHRSKPLIAKHGEQGNLTVWS